MPLIIPFSPFNRLLAILPRRDRQRLLASARQVHLESADILTDCGDRIRHVYFPIDSSISLTARIAGDGDLDVGLVGDEGMLGIELVLGVDVTPHIARVQGAGAAIRMDVATFRRELSAGPALLRLLKRYAHVLMGQLAQSAVCTRYHMVEARLARLLLMTQDRAHSQRVHLTHELLAGRLGVRRAGITAAATALQQGELISYHRGDILILDRTGLKRAACSCYDADIATYARTLNHGHAPKARRGALAPCSSPAR